MPLRSLRSTLLTAKAAKGEPERSLRDAERPAAYKVDDFQLITLVQLGFRPTVARSNFLVEFDGYAIGFDAKGLDKLGDGERRLNLEDLLISINLQFHSRIFS